MTEQEELARRPRWQVWVEDLLAHWAAEIGYYPEHAAAMAETYRQAAANDTVAIEDYESRPVRSHRGLQAFSQAVSSLERLRRYHRRLAAYWELPWWRRIVTREPRWRSRDEP